MRVWLILWRTAAAAGALVLCAPAIAEPTDTAVKAAFLPRFARYVTWPAVAMPRGDDPFVLCVIGGDPFGAALDDAARSQFVDGRRIVVRRMRSATGVESCQIAFVQASKVQSPAQLIAAFGRRSVLTVTDANTGAQRGIIHFSVVGGRVRFFIDQSSATRNGLAISSRLLALAIGVKQ
jgi:hypothetical protein